MIKQPRAGRVKTRLGADLGMTTSAWWFRHQSQKLIRNLSRDKRWKTILAVSPDVDCVTSRVWPYHLTRWAQGQGNLGDRMGAIFSNAPIGPVVIIGADIPNITCEKINSAFKALDRNDAVLGPATDGGYWLIGLKRSGRPVPKSIFQGVTWSSPDTMEQTIQSMQGQKIAYIDTLQDVDTVQDLRALKPSG